MSDAPQLLANIGAEEGPDWERFAGHSAVARLAELWRELFEPEPVFPWLPREGLVAWLNTEEAHALAERSGLPLTGASPEVVDRVHDKAFATRVAEREGLIAEPLHGTAHIFEHEDLVDPEAVLARIDAALATWPSVFGGRFALKPRLGTSGRGRVAERSAVAGALPRLRARGGAVLEPWLERTVDLSTQLYIAPDSTITLIGSAELVVSPSGVYAAHCGTVDARGRASSGHRLDEALREGALVVAQAAAAEGYCGPCGVDAFVFRCGDREILRPVVELNARYTTGTVALGQLRRALPELKRSLGLAPGELRSFAFALARGSETAQSAPWKRRLGSGGEAILAAGPVDAQLLAPTV